jgi:hypothetical protein
MEKINRMADNLGVDEMWNAAREYLKKHGGIPPDEPGEAEAIEGPAGPDEEPQEGPSDALNWMSV